MWMGIVIQQHNTFVTIVDIDSKLAASTIHTISLFNLHSFVFHHTPLMMRIDPFESLQLAKI
jgi:hypothetical protein